jgi:hypothetical protein
VSPPLYQVWALLRTVATSTAEYRTVTVVQSPSRAGTSAPASVTLLAHTHRPASVRHMLLQPSGRLSRVCVLVCLTQFHARLCGTKAASEGPRDHHPSSTHTQLHSHTHTHTHTVTHTTTVAHSPNHTVTQSYSHTVTHTATQPHTVLFF